MSHFRGSFAVATAVLVVVVAMCSSADAQRGGDRGGRSGGDRGRGGDRGSRSGGSDFRQRILERIDRNGNGLIDRDEMEGRGGDFVRNMARDRGIDPDRGALSIKVLTGQEGVSKSPGTNEPTPEDPYPPVPRFGEEQFPTFGLSPQTLAGRIVDIEKKYDRRILEITNRTMERYDKNKNGILEHDEWSSVPWRGDPRESDLDNDGNLTRAEMAERYVARESNSSRDRGRDSRDRGSDRGGDRGRGDRGRGGSDERAEMFRQMFAGRGGSFGGSFGRGRGGDDSGRGRGGRGGRDRGGDDRGGEDRSARIAGFITAMAARRDANKDGILQPDEVDDRTKRWIGERFKIDFAKPVKIATLTKRVGGGESDEKGERAAFTTVGAEITGRATYAQSGSRPLPKMLPDWWEKDDKNTDGQVSMAEFLATRSSQEKAITEFYDYDANRDGVVTAREAEAVETDK